MSAAFLSALELRDSYARRERSPVEVTAELLERIERHDSDLRCFITVTADLAMEQAKAAEAAITQGRGGPLCGVPVGLKDLFDLAGVRCTSGSRILADEIPARDAWVVERLREAGAVCLGKQNMHEFAYGITNTNDHWGACRNPWNRERVPGGSSGGGGAALAAGLCTLAIGTDTGGSIRIPAAACGVVGLKPTFGRVSRRGVFPLAWTMDHVGPMTRTVADAALMLSVLAVADPEDPWCVAATEPEDFSRDLERGVHGLRIGVPGEPFWIDLDPAVAKAVEEAIALLVELGAHRVDLDGRGLSDAYTAFHAILATEASAIHERWMRERPADYGPATRQALARGYFVAAVDYVNARREQARVRGGLDAMLRDADVLVTPTLPRAAPPIGEPMSREPALAWNRLVPPFNLSGLPALSLPCGFDGAGLPIGLQIAGRRFDEATVLRVGAAYERATEWHRRQPPEL